MTDKIKLKADKFVNDKKLKLNYIKPKDLKLLLAEFCEEQIAELKAECDLAIEGRDVKIAELETRCNELFLQTCEQAEKIKELRAKESFVGDQNRKLCEQQQKIEVLEKENAELKKWKYEWQEQAQKATDEGYARTLQTIQLTKAKVFIRSLKSLIEDVCDINYLSKDNTRLLVEAEQFLNEVEK